MSLLVRVGILGRRHDHVLVVIGSLDVVHGMATIHIDLLSSSAANGTEQVSLVSTICFGEKINITIGYLLIQINFLG